MGYNRIYIFGGTDQQGNPQRYAEYFDTAHSLPVGSWEAAPPMPEPRAQAAGLNVNGYAYLCGGSNGHQQLGTVARFNPAAGLWDVQLSMLTPRAFASAGVLGGYPYVFGGFG